MTHASRAYIKTGKSDPNPKFNRDDHDCCVLHLVDASSGDDDLEARHIQDYISSQHPELWKEMRAGDMIENISESGYRSQGLYLVDEEAIQTEGEYIIRNGLCIVKQCTDYDDYGTVPRNFYAITRFPIGYYDLYFENLESSPVFVNKKYCDADNQAYWHIEPCLMPLDKAKLKLDILTPDEVFELTVNNISLYHTIITYRKTNYLLATESNTVEEHIDTLKSIPYYEFNSLVDDERNEYSKKGDSNKTNAQIIKYLQKENIDPHNAWILSE